METAERASVRGTFARLWRMRAGRVGRWLGGHVLSSLTRRIVLLNLAGLMLLLLAILYLNQYRSGLIEARVQSLQTQGEIIAAAVAGSATVDQGAITVDPERLLDMDPGDPEDPFDAQRVTFGIDPERVAPVLRRLVGPARIRARIYDRLGVLVLDSRFLLVDRGPPHRVEGGAEPQRLSFSEQVWRQIRVLLGRQNLPRYRELGATEGRGYQEVVGAIEGHTSSVVRVNERGELIVSVATAVQRSGATIGVLLLNTQGGEIDAIVDAERMAILRVFVVACVIMILLSILLSNSIAGPVRRLADAAERVRRGTRKREDIPDFTERQDEIGHLSGALRDMTGALYDRIEAIERFAADVAHELKNPLTSLRSAVETLPLARRDEDRARLLDIIRHDVRRLDRLITDISDASRLDAELQRERSEQVDVARILGAVVQIQNDTRRDGGPAIRLTVVRHALGTKAYMVEGHDVRLGQVFANLLDNAKSFSPADGEVRVSLGREGGVVEIVVDDDGPGISVEPIERIFERFYTDRPETAFGNNSGLGLSISRQIVEAHRGTIVAENRVVPDASAEGGLRRLGARFIVRLPAA